MKKFFFWTLLVFFFLLSVEVLSFGTLFLLKKLRNVEYKPLNTKEISQKHKDILLKLINNDNEYMDFSPSLGWKVKDNGASGLYRANSAGFRADREYSVGKLEDKIRIASFGDSFTHGDEVDNKNTWQSKMEEGKSSLEALNFGVGAYGLDQAYLLYRELGMSYDPDIVFIGYMTENIARNVSVFRPFYYVDTSAPLTKPRFVADSGQLRLLENPIKSAGEYRELINEPGKILPLLGSNDFYYKNSYHESIYDLFCSVRLLKLMIYEHFRKKTFDNQDYRTDSEAFNITLKIFDKFVSDALENGSLPIILVFPYDFDLYQYGKYGKKRYQPLISYFESRGYIYADIQEAFNQLGGGYSMKDFFLVSHYTPLGNSIVSKYLLAYLGVNRLFERDIIRGEIDKYKLRLINKKN